MIDVCVRCDQMDKAWNLLNEMQTEGKLQPDNFTYSTIIKGIKCDSRNFSTRNLDKAFMLLDQMKLQNQVKPDEILYNCLIDACVRFKDVNRAVAVFHQMGMEKIRPSSVTYGILIKAYGQSN
jgi:pentatricopeptide repeat domain-containing protein 1